MSDKIFLIASLYLVPGHEAAFRKFETKASVIMRKYGGNIDQVIRPTASPSGQPLAHEVHLVSFPNMEQFEAYRRDAELAGLSSLRESAIARTEIVMGEEGPPYG
jgi:antibiotic biosynthesis monooxygenase (ABM) superfamily enzyme